MYYIVYKITNKINGKIYIGSHKTKNLNDDYMGSGKYLKRAQDKYGIENFQKEIIFVYDNSKEMYEKEREIVNEEFLKHTRAYNLKLGGNGGFDYVNSNPDQFLTEKRLNSLMTNEQRSKRWILLYNNSQEFRDVINKNLTKAKQVQMELYPDGTFKGKNHSDETKRLIGEKNSVSQAGSKNSQYGTRWIHSLSLKISKKIKKDDPLPDGWIEGRKIKFY